MTRLLAPVLVVVCAVPLWAADDNPYKNARVGDYATFKIKTEVAGLSMTGEMTQTVTKRTDKEATVQISGYITFMGNKQQIPPQEQKIDITQPYDPTKAPGQLPPGTEMKVEKGKEGKEKLMLGQKTYTCTWTEYKASTTINGMEFSFDVKVWMSQDVPMGMVKMQMTGMPGGQKMTMSMELEETGNRKSSRE